LAGHLGPLIGDTAEKDVKRLLELLGYSIIKENVIHPNIDKIVKFIGEPKPKSKYPCLLKKPIFSPSEEDIIAVSIKKGNFSDSDITNLLENIEDAKRSEKDITLQNIKSGILISNYTKSPSEIDRYLDRGIYCWDLCRLLFYASKASKAKKLSNMAPVREYNIDLNIKSSYLRLWNLSTAHENILPVKFLLFIDEHDSDFIYSADHHSELMEYLYCREIKTMMEERDISVEAQFEVHVLGKANPDLVTKAHIDFSRKYLRSKDEEIGALFTADIPIFQYSISPWSVLIN